MADADDSYLVCLRTGTTDIVVPGSMKKKCSACQHSVWVSPASWKLSQQRKLPILCMPCAELRAAKDDDVQVQMPTVEQLREVVKTLKKDITERN